MRRRDRPMEPEVLHGLRELDAALAGEPGAEPELALLVADVRSAKPEPDSAFLARLDAQVHAGFPRDAAPAPERSRRRRRLLLAPGLAGVAAAAIVALVLAGGGAKDDNAVNQSARPSGPAAPIETAGSASSSDSAAAPSMKAAPAAPSAAGDSSASTSSPRRVERSAQLTLTPAPGDVQDVADGVVRTTQAVAGYVAQSSVSTQDGAGTAQFTLRIPTARVDDALARLSKLAHVGSLTQDAHDITATVASAAQRLADARDERRALLTALGRATTDRQVAALKARLRANRSEISRRKGELAAVARRADMATVQVTVEGTGHPSHNGGGAWTPRDAWHDAGRVLQLAGGVTVIAAAVLLPLALLAALAGALAHVLRRRRRESALDQLV